MELVESLKDLQIDDTFVRLQALMHVPTRSWFDSQGSLTWGTIASGSLVSTVRVSSDLR